MFLPLTFTSGRAIIESIEESDTVKRNASDTFYVEEKKRAALVEAGKLVRSSALGHGETVKVFFSGKSEADGKYYLMDSATYRSFPLIVALTVEDFAAVGPVVEATVADLYDPS